MDFLKVHQSSGTFYTGLDNDELERLPETLLIHHAVPNTTPDGLPLRGVVFSRGLTSLCDRRVDVVIPSRFDPADPAACARCVEVALAVASRPDAGPA